MSSRLSFLISAIQENDRMKTFGNISVAFIIGILPALAGCTTTSSDSKNTNVSINKGSFEAGDGKIGNDIKTILAQGGLDANNPASTAVASNADSTPKTLSTTATDLKTLVAQLDANSGLAPSVPAPSTTPQTPSSSAKATSSDKPQALALAEAPKQTKAGTQIVTTTQTTTFEPIGKPAVELIPVTPEPVGPTNVAAASEKPSPRPTSKPRRAVEDESSYKEPTVKRF